MLPTPKNLHCSGDSWVRILCPWILAAVKTQDTRESGCFFQLRNPRQSMQPGPKQLLRPHLLWQMLSVTCLSVTLRLSELSSLRIAPTTANGRCGLMRWDPVLWSATLWRKLLIATENVALVLHKLCQVSQCECFFRGGARSSLVVEIQNTKTIWEQLGFLHNYIL